LAEHQGLTKLARKYKITILRMICQAFHQTSFELHQTDQLN